MSFEIVQVFDRDPRERINPYLIAGDLLAQRLIWDINPLSWKARSKLKRWKNRFPKQRAVILCNGPSLNNVDFNLLLESSVFTFGLNKINLLFDKSFFRPSCIVSVNPFVIEQNIDFFNTTCIPLFIDSKCRKLINFRPNIHFICSVSPLGRFACDCSISINQGATVTYVAMQLAFHMGFIDVALVGCDHNFQTEGPPNKTVQAKRNDPNHFDSKYFSNGVSWQLPDLKTSELHYEKAKNIFQHFGRRIVNCSVGGKLEIFERMDLARFLKQST